MRIVISNKDKKELFISVFHVLKNCSSIISCTFKQELLHIQGMDKSHVCLFNLEIQHKWFDEYNIIDQKQISFDSNVFHSIISTKSEKQDLIIKMEDDNEDIVFIQFLPTISVVEEQEQEPCEDSDNKKKGKKIKKGTEDKKVTEGKKGLEGKKEKEKEKNEFKKLFKMPLTEYDYEEMNIPVVDYDAEFSLSSKLVTDIFSQLNNFGNDIIVKCSEESIHLTTNSITGEMCVQIPIDDLTSYSVIEGEEVELIYSLMYVNKMCITSKISNEIDFSLSKESPMKISYDLGDDSSIVFYMAPKVSD
jgi:hypothetical protein